MTTVLARQIPCHNCIQLCSGRMHLQCDFSKRGTPRPAPKIVLKSAWQSQRQQQQQQDTSESAASGTKKLVQKEEQGTRTDNPELPSVRKLMRGTESLVEQEEDEFIVDSEFKELHKM